MLAGPQAGRANAMNSGENADKAQPVVNANNAPSSVPVAKPVDVVIAVDESGSIRPAEMTEEQQAARLIALAILWVKDFDS